MLQYEVICTFRRTEQIVVTVSLRQTKDSLKRPAFLRAVFECLTVPELQQLVKLSCAQLFTRSASELPTFIQSNNGKFYFNADVNNDTETRRLLRFKNDYIQSNLSFFAGAKKKA